MEKTHWLQNPNKNYLGHWDLPESGTLILTIKSANWEEVKNPIINTSEAKRVVRFQEDVKPLICNETNAKSISKATGVKYMEDSGGFKIELYRHNIIDRKTKENIDCIRVRDRAPKVSKPVMDESSKNWDSLKERIKTDSSITIESIRKHYDITQENFDKLCG